MQFLIYEPASKAMNEYVEFPGLLEPLRWNVSLFHSHISEDADDICELHVLWAEGGACVASRAHPEDVGGENFLSHTKDGHPDYLSRIVFIVNLCHGARCGAGAACEALHEGLGTGLRCDMVLEVRVFLGEDDLLHL